MTLFFDVFGPVLVEWIPKGTTINTARYVDTLIRVANITDFSVEVRNLENDPYFSRFLYGVSKFTDILRILQCFDFFQHF